MIVMRLPKEGPETALLNARKCWVCKSPIEIGENVVHRLPDTRFARHVCCNPVPVRFTITMAPTEDERPQRRAFGPSKRRHGRFPADV